MDMEDIQEQLNEFLPELFDENIGRPPNLKERAKICSIKHNNTKPDKSCKEEQDKTTIINF